MDVRGRSWTFVGVRGRSEPRSADVCVLAALPRHRATLSSDTANVRNSNEADVASAESRGYARRASPTVRAARRRRAGPLGAPLTEDFIKSKPTQGAARLSTCRTQSRAAGPAAPRRAAPRAEAFRDAARPAIKMHYPIPAPAGAPLNLRDYIGLVSIVRVCIRISRRPVRLVP